MSRRLAAAVAVTGAGAGLMTAGFLARAVEVPWAAVYPLALLVAYCAGSLVFGRRAA